MSTYTVTKIRKEQAEGCSHRHLEGVITDAGLHYTRREVVDSIRAGNVWLMTAPDGSAVIHPLAYCPRGTCLATPYLATFPGSLENLPEG